MLTPSRNAESKTRSEQGNVHAACLFLEVERNGNTAGVCFHQLLKFEKAGMFGIMSLRTIKSQSLEVFICCKTTTLKLFTDFSSKSGSNNCNTDVT